MELVGWDMFWSSWGWDVCDCRGPVGVVRIWCSCVWSFGFFFGRIWWPHSSCVWRWWFGGESGGLGGSGWNDLVSGRGD